MKKQSLTIDISDEARSALREIYHYTTEHWGTSQARRYTAMFDEAFGRLSDNPALGHVRPDISPRYRAYVVGSHIIIYRVISEILQIIAIFHQRMNIEAHLSAIYAKSKM